MNQLISSSSTHKRLHSTEPDSLIRSIADIPHYNISSLTQLFDAPLRKRQCTQQEIDYQDFINTQELWDEEPSNLSTEHVIFDDRQLGNESSIVKEHSISFLTTPKCVDVKALKNIIWKEILELSKGGVYDRQSCDFQSVLTKLPKVINSHELANISVSFSFVCLLHLANERNLNLTQNNQHTLYITKN